MKRFLLVILFLAGISSIDAYSQSYLTRMEIGFNFGASQYFGDLNDNYGFKTIAPAGGIYMRRHMNNYISLKLMGNFTHLGYDDKYNSDPYEKIRNLNFQSDVYEMSFQAEFNFFKFITGDRYYRVTPYLTGGVGVFYFDPKTTYQGKKYSLKEEGTEGQYVGFAGRKYQNMSPCFPIGLGVKAWLLRGVNVTFEIADRLSTTDYLDDVSSTYVGTNRFPNGSIAAALQDRSVEVTPNTPLGRSGKQRGNTSSFDQYIMAILSVSFHFTTYKCPSNFNNYDYIRAY